MSDECTGSATKTLFEDVTTVTLVPTQTITVVEGDGDVGVLFTLRGLAHGQTSTGLYLYILDRRYIELPLSDQDGRVFGRGR